MRTVSPSGSYKDVYNHFTLEDTRMIVCPAMAGHSELYVLWGSAPKPTHLLPVLQSGSCSQMHQPVLSYRGQIFEKYAISHVFLNRMLNHHFWSNPCFSGTKRSKSFLSISLWTLYVDVNISSKRTDDRVCLTRLLKWGPP